jgi:hypothetical protein
MHLHRAQSRSIPLRLTWDGTGQAALGVLYSQIIVYIGKDGGPLVYRPVLAEEWVDRGHNGLYRLILNGTDTDAEFELQVLIEGPNLHSHTGLFDVTDVDDEDLYEHISTRATPADVQVSGGFTIEDRTKLDYLDVAVSSRTSPTDIPPVPADVMRNTDPRLDYLDSTISSRATAVDVTTAFNVITPLVQRIIGLVGANRVVDSEVLDVNKRLTSARIRTYDSVVNAQASGSTGLLGTYNVSASFTLAGACTMIVTEVLP